MFGQHPPPAGSKPSTAAKPVAGRWGPNAGSDNSNTPSTATKSSFLHSAPKSNPWNQNASKTFGNTDQHSSSNGPVIAPKKPWEQNASTSFGNTDQHSSNGPVIASKKPWEQNKPTENDNKSAFNRFQKTTDEDSNKSDPPWLKNNGVKKTASFNTASNAKPGVFRKPDPSPNSTSTKEDTTPPWLKSRQENQTDKNDSNSQRTHFGSNNFPKPPETSSKPSWSVNKVGGLNDDRSEKSEHVGNAIAKKPSFCEKPNAFDNTPKVQTGGPVSRNRSFMEQKSAFNKPSGNAEKTSGGIPSALNRFGSDIPQAPPKLGDGPTIGGTISRDKHSFLHKTQPATVKPAPERPTTKERRKRPIPDDVLNRPPPAKPRKPLNARLPGENNTINARRNAPSFINKSNRGGSMNSSLSPGKPLPVAPSPPPSNFLSPGDDQLALPRPPSPGMLRNLPPTPSRQPAPPIDDEVYDDTTAAAPPLPMSSHPNIGAGPGFDEIPTWDDEEPEQIYDETPDEGGPIVPERIPEEDEGDDMYEDLDQYSKFKGQANGASNVLPPPREEKPKKEIDKKEKGMRKKFQLPLDGEVPIENIGFIRADVKGFNKMTLRANERVDIIRKANNPKGKWLIRTENGQYGYAEPDNVNENSPYSSRSGAVPPTPQMQQGAPALPPPLPAMHNAGQPPPIPTMQEDEEIEAIYDETPEPEELYEEL